MAIVYLAIGSNLGNREENIRDAMAQLEAGGMKILNASSLIETDPVGGPSGQGKFLNGALKIETLLAPLDLLTQLHNIEKRLGRTKTVHNGPRPIDLDILLYDHLHMQTERLTIPHPRMWKRDFVMIPLKEINPELTEERLHAHHP